MRSKLVATCMVAAAASFALLAVPCGAQATDQGTGAHSPQNAPQSTAPTAADQNFVNQAIKANDQEIDQARAELASSNDPSVRLFAQRMINDHSSANAQIAAVAKQLKLHYPSSHIVTDHGSGQNQLNAPQNSPGSPPPAANQPNAAALPPRQYMQQEVKDHQQAIALFENEAKNGQPQLRSLAADMLPELNAHLAMAQQYSNTGRITPVGTPTPAANPPR